MTQTYEAIYENGVFRPLKDLPNTLAEGQHVRVVVETDGTRRSIVDVLAEAPGHLCFHNADEVDAYVQEERGAWEN